MNSILIPISPKGVAKTLKGDKTIIILKTAPKDWIDYISGKTKAKPTPKTAYIYCTKGNRFLFKSKSGEHYLTRCLVGSLTPLNAKVVAKFTIADVYVINDFCNGLEATEPTDRNITVFHEEELLKASCLSKRQIEDYGGIYVLRISDLEIFDKPMELTEFSPYRKYGIGDYFEGNETEYLTLDEIDKALFPKPLTKAPSSWCYVEVNKK